MATPEQIDIMKLMGYVLTMRNPDNAYDTHCDILSPDGCYNRLGWAPNPQAAWDYAWRELTGSDLT